MKIKLFKDKLEYVLKKPESNNMLHCHTENSLADGAQTVEQMIDKAIENKATAVAITDHGVAAGWLDAMDYGKEKGIKVIPGVEAYIRGMHLLLLAKNYAGFQALSNFITETNEHMEKGRPQGTKEMLEKYFGPGTEGHGNVVSTSACISGVIAYCLSDGYRIDYEISKIQKKIDSIIIPDEYEKIKAVLEKMSAKEKKVADEIKSCTTLAKKTYKKAEVNIRKLKDDDMRASALAALEKEKEESVLAAARIPDLKEKQEKLKEKMKPLKEAMRKCNTKLGNIEKYNEEIKSLDNSRKTEPEMLQDARAEIYDYRHIFGKDDFYIEVQYHGYEHEGEIYPKLVKLANETKTKLVATNDAHFARPEDMFTRTLLLNAGYALNSQRWMDAQPGDDQIYMKSGREMAASLAEILPEEDICAAFNGIMEITDKCNVVIPDTKHYPKIKNAKEELRERCESGILKRYPDGIPAEKRKKLEYELEIIDRMGYNDYFCEIADIIKFAKDSADNSIEIGPGRGSGVGSIVCYVTEITEVDPGDYDLMFERFLNPDRVSMPDIDTDFSEHARAISLSYVKEKYGTESVANIMTKNRMAAKAALDYAGKLYGIQQYEDKSRYTTLVKNMKECLTEKATAIKDGKETIVSLYGNDTAAMSILDYAERMEGYTTSFGTHAAGVIIGDGNPIRNFIPLIRITTKKDGKETVTWAIQANMTQAEADLGFIKMDVRTVR